MFIDVHRFLKILVDFRQMDFTIIQEFITPIVKVTPKRNKKDVRNFYSLPEFQKWQDEVPNPQAYDVKYYKVLFLVQILVF